MENDLVIHYRPPDRLSVDTIAALPLLPLSTVSEQGFLYPKQIKNPTAAQILLDTAVEQEIGRRAEIGVISQVLLWNGASFMVGAFDPRTGLQVGFGQAIWDPDPKQRESTTRLMGYEISLVVASKYEGLGLAKIMHLHLESYMAGNIGGLGVYLLSHIEAVSRHSRSAVLSIMQKVGARPTSVQGFDGWFIKLVLKEQVPHMPQILTIHDLLLTKKRNHIELPLGITYNNHSFYAGRERIAWIKKGRIRFTGSTEYKEQMFELWKAAKRARFSAGLALQQPSCF